MAGLTKTNFAETAENVMKNLKAEKEKGKRMPVITTSKIRNFLNMTNKLKQELRRNNDDVLSDEMKRDIQYFKMRLAYECGREKSNKSVMNFVEKSEIMKLCDEIGSESEKLGILCDYMESLVAYHKYYRLGD